LPDFNKPPREPTPLEGLCQKRAKMGTMGMLRFIFKKNEKNKVRKPLVSDFVLNSFRTHNAKEGSEALGFCFCVIRKTEIIKIYKNIEKHRKTDEI
jgi:hypothetical protein